ncbi:MAG: hypothetical protein LBN96_07710 [Desulfovibrio sp.]|jgi:hypothetical protein|nr:hypothetical protein [Desulfovibrio sp.]
MYEYDPNKVSMSRLRLAYALNDHEAEIVMAGLWPHALFPLELWRKTHDLFWRGFADTVTRYYSIKSPEFPESNATKEKYFHAHLYAREMENLFSMLASRVHMNALREGLRYIVSMTYENSGDIPFQDKMDCLFEKLSMIEENNDYTFTQRLANEEFTALMEEKIFTIPPSWYFFIPKMYPDTIFVDTVSAIRRLHFLNIPFKTEVKGITRALVDSVHSALAQEAASAAAPAEQPQEKTTAPHSTGSRKDLTRINATRQACEEVAEELLQEKRLFESSKDTWKQRLLFDNGKTNWNTFSSAVESRLGQPPHYEAARAEWKKLPEGIKHKGRVREQ